jgi:hypothetical protein
LSDITAFDGMIQELDNLIDETIDKEEFDTYISKVRNQLEK